MDRTETAPAHKENIRCGEAVFIPVRSVVAGFPDSCESSEAGRDHIPSPGWSAVDSSSPAAVESSGISSTVGSDIFVPVSSASE